MPEMTEPYYVSMLKGHGFTPDPDDHQYGALGLCWKISQEIGEGSYWTYGQKDLYDIKIHNFSFHKDSLLEFSLPECLSISGLRLPCRYCYFGTLEQDYTFFKQGLICSKKMVQNHVGV